MPSAQVNTIPSPPNTKSTHLQSAQVHPIPSPPIYKVHKSTQYKVHPIPSPPNTKCTSPPNTKSTQYQVHKSTQYQVHPIPSAQDKSQHNVKMTFTLENVSTFLVALGIVVCCHALDPLPLSFGSSIIQVAHLLDHFHDARKKFSLW